MTTNERNVQALFFGMSLLLFSSSAQAESQQGHSHPHTSHHADELRRAPDDLTERESLAVRLYKESVPTVVLIRTRGARPQPDGSFAQSLGSGVLISNENHILTAAHVVDGAQTILVKTNDGKERRAQRLFSEPEADIALLQLEDRDQNLPFASLGDSSRLAVGQDLFVIGNPRGLANTFTRGTLSGFRDHGSLYDGTIRVDFLQTDAAINSGNSGGPVFDSKGRVVGIASRISTRSGGSEGLGFAVTINSAKRLLALEDRQWTGLRGTYLGALELASLFNLDLPGALLVQNVESASPASEAGLRGGSIPLELNGRELLLGGDLILQIGHQQACHSSCLVKAHQTLRKESQVLVVFLRNGKRQQVVMDLSATRRNYIEAKAPAPEGVPAR